METTKILLLLTIVIILVCMLGRVEHLIQAYSDNPVSRQWIANIPLDCPVQPGATLIINENKEE